MPQFAKLYHDLGIPLPPITQFMLDLAIPLRDYFLVVVGVAVGLSAPFSFGRAPTRAPWSLIASSRKSRSSATSG